ncbi:hypothetical protein [Streptomyces sp. NPDC048611]|uniref:hypothetical protein n=1 Tax=Streptomyces sp. NPDC048611 TaxID=3155635 RepID=UPI00342DC647
MASVLAPDYQRVLEVLAGSKEALSCKELAAGLGMEPVPAKVEGVRSKANQLVGRDWLLKKPSGRFVIAPGLRGGGS